MNPNESELGLIQTDVISSFPIDFSKNKYNNTNNETGLISTLSIIFTEIFGLLQLHLFANLVI